MDGQNDDKAATVTGPARAAPMAGSDGDDLSLRPWTDDDELEGWEVVATSETGGPIGLRYCVDLTPDEARLVVRAEQLVELNYLAIAKQAILAAAHEVMAGATASTSATSSADRPS